LVLFSAISGLPFAPGHLSCKEISMASQARPPHFAPQRLKPDEYGISAGGLRACSTQKHRAAPSSSFPKWNTIYWCLIKSI